MDIRKELLTTEQQSLLDSINSPEFQLYLDIKDFDYYYAYTDDGSVYKTWRRKEEEINDRLKNLNSQYKSSLCSIWEKSGKGEIVIFESLKNQLKEERDYLHAFKVLQNLDGQLVDELYGLVHCLLKLKELGTHKRFYAHNKKLCFSKKSELKIPPKNLVNKITLSDQEQLWIDECGGYTRDVYEALKHFYITICCLFTTDEFVTKIYENKSRKLTVGNFTNLCWAIRTGKSEPSGELVTREQVIKLVPLIQELRK